MNKWLTYLVISFLVITVIPVSAQIDKILKLKNSLINTPKTTFPVSVDTIINKANERPDIIERIIERLKIPAKLVPAIQFAVFLCVIGLSILTYLFFTSVPKAVYITKINGNVEINEQPFNNEKYKFNYEEQLKLKILNGECTLQIHNEKLIIIKAYSDIILKKEKDHILTLNNGTILCSVKKDEKDDDLYIKTKDASFKIVGTRFYVIKNKYSTELGVEQGKVESGLPDQTLIITNQTGLRIKKNKKKIFKLKKNKMTIFKQFDHNEFIDDLKKVIPVCIDSKPVNSIVYKESIAIGKTPLFYLSTIDEKETTPFFITKKGYLPEKFYTASNDMDEIYFNLNNII